MKRILAHLRNRVQKSLPPVLLLMRKKPSILLTFQSHPTLTWCVGTSLQPKLFEFITGTKPGSNSSLFLLAQLTIMLQLLLRFHGLTVNYWRMLRIYSTILRLFLRGLFFQNTIPDWCQLQNRGIYPLPDSLRLATPNHFQHSMDSYLYLQIINL